MGRRQAGIPLPQWSADRRRLHERAAAASFDAWTAAQLLPSVCEEIGAPVPRWARELLEHAETLLEACPPAVLEALRGRSEKGTILARSRPVRRWGLAMGLWEGEPQWPRVSSLGIAVAELLEQQQADERAFGPARAER